MMAIFSITMTKFLNRLILKAQNSHPIFISNDPVIIYIIEQIEASNKPFSPLDVHHNSI